MVPTAAGGVGLALAVVVVVVVVEVREVGERRMRLHPPERTGERQPPRVGPSERRQRTTRRGC